MLVSWFDLPQLFKVHSGHMEGVLVLLLKLINHPYGDQATPS